MKEIIIGICDDQQIILQELHQIVTQVCEKWNEPWEVRPFGSGEDMLMYADEMTIAFLDIEMPDMDGIELGKKLGEKNPNCKIIMATGKVERYKEAFKINAFRFVTKPFNIEEIEEALDAAKASDFAGRTIELYSHRNKIEVLQEKIRYVESYDGYAEFTVDTQKFRKDSSLDELETVLDERLFIRISRKHIVNLRWITSYKGNKVYIEDEVFTVSRRRLKEFERKYIEYDLNYKRRG